MSRARVGLTGVLAVLLALVAACGDGGSGGEAAPATSQGAGAAACPAATPAQRDVAYASDDLQQVLDIYPAPHGCPAPVVVWVHGGGWQRGDKRNQLEDKVRLWNDAGYTVVSVDYRLTDPAAATPVRFPTHAQDVASALAWVHDNVVEYGGDPDRVAVLGHSAGAQLAATVATNSRYLGAHGLGLDALQCAGALDTEGYDVTAMVGRGNAVYRAAFGDDPVAWADASPIEHVRAGAGIPRFLVVERGSPRRVRTAEAFVARLRNAGVPVTVVEAGSLSHAEVNAVVGQSDDSVVTPPLEAFLAECFAPTP